MTRVNVIEPELLLNQHLMAEIREMPMVIASYRRSLQSKKGVDYGKLPVEYTLNRGHVSFFYFYGGWLKKRWDAIIAEAVKRGWNVDPTRMVFDVWEQNGTMNDYAVTQKDYLTNLQRIYQRYTEKPHIYTLTSTDLTVEGVVEWYKIELGVE